MKITKELIFEHFANKITPLQRRHIDEWLRLKANEEFYYKWLEEWERNNPEYAPESTELLNNYLNFIALNTSENEDVEETRPDLVARKWWIFVHKRKVAAGFLLLVVSAVSMWFLRTTIQYQNYETRIGETRSFYLEDGSQVMLNPKSSLLVPRWGFGEKNREVILTGEAGFSVTHLSGNQKFIVKTNKDFEVVVLGTEFSVTANDRVANIALKNGSVKVNYNTQHQVKEILMEPGELITFDKDLIPKKTKLIEPQNFSIWEPRRFVFEEMKLSEVAQMLEETYGLSIEITSEKLADRKLIGSFRAKNLDELLNTISEVMHIAVVRKNNIIQFKEYP